MKHGTEEKKYQGWSNWETWCAALWLNNTPEWYFRLLECQNADDVQQLYDEAVETGYITDRISRMRIDFQEIYNDAQIE